MCGIGGILSQEDEAVDKVVDILKKLEYRGYDSAGVAFFNGKDIEIVKAKGKVTNLINKLNKKTKSNCAMGHTRWATHGIANDINAHPHYSDNIVLVHNGIIENHKEIKNFLLKHKVSFYSDTDSEIVGQLIDYYYKLTNNPIEAISSALKQIIGSYALIVAFKNIENSLYAITYNEPLIVCATDKNNILIASDAKSIYDKKGSKDFFFLNNYELAIIANQKIIFKDLNGKDIIKKSRKLDLDVQPHSKNGYDTFMLKEINEQTDILIKLLSTHIYNNEISFKVDKVDIEKFKNIKKIRIIGCGSAYNSGLIAKYFFEQLANIKTEVLISSEFRYDHFIKEKDVLNIVISQSGETADTLAALNILIANKEKIIAITNNATSTIANKSKNVILLNCGDEYSVASTKAFSAQVFLLHLLSIKFGFIKQVISGSELAYLNQATTAIYNSSKILEDKTIENIAKIIANYKNVFFLGRGLNYAICCEAALKLKELSYINCNAYAAGELKHGPISLIDNSSLIISFFYKPTITDEKTLSNVAEVRSREAKIICIGNEEIHHFLNDDDLFLNNYATDNHFAYLNSIYVLQLLSYYVALTLKRDVDNPRNLAKSVTVE